MDKKPTEKENVRVCLRVRPLNVKEISEGLQDITNCKNDENVISIKKLDNKEAKTFRFCKIFPPRSSQMEVYRYTTLPIVEKVFQGYNGTIFAYGQSGTGKTHTILGHPIKTNLKGIVPNIFSHIFTEISLANKDVSYVVTVTYLEIYNEEVRDLLSSDSSKKLTLRERKDVGVYVKDLLGFTVNSIEAVTDLLVRGNKRRATNSTKLNKTSSRSHAIFTVLLETKNHVTKKTSFGKLNVVDLAGSERVHKTLARGDRLIEATKINLSLTVLGNVISALVDGKYTHIPYRNSKLTRLLQDSLGGNSITTMIAMISPSEVDYEESLYTLLYADRVKHIQNFVKLNTENCGSVLENFEFKIKELQEKLSSLSLDEPKNKTPTSKRSSTRLSDRDDELQQVINEKSSLLHRIQSIQDKILIGGVNLLEKAQEQSTLLTRTAKELEDLDQSHQELEQSLEFYTKEKDSVTKSHASLQEEDKDITLKIEEAEAMILKARALLSKKEIEYQNEISSLLFVNKGLAKEMGLVNLIISNCISKKDLVKINSHLEFDEQSQEWNINGIAYAGNNLKKRKMKDEKSYAQNETKEIYLNYEKQP